MILKIGQRAAPRGQREGPVAWVEVGETKGHTNARRGSSSHWLTCSQLVFGLTPVSGRGLTKCVVKSGGLSRSQALGAGVAAVTHPDRVVPAPGGNGPEVAGAGPAHTLSTGPAVVLGHGRCEAFRALVTLGNVLVWYPVVRPGDVLHKA